MRLYDKRDYKKLLSFIKSEYDISVKEYKKDWGISYSNCWFECNQSITVGTYADYWYESIAVLAHELGHCLSVRKKKNIKMATYLLYKFNAPLTEKQGTAILAEERRAWRYGFKTLRDLGIEVDERMIAFREARIRGHVKTIKRLNKS